MRVVGMEYGDVVVVEFRWVERVSVCVGCDG